MRRTPVHITGLALVMLFAGECAAFAQSPSHAAKQGNVPAPQAHATVDRTKILIGEPIQLMLETTVNGNAPLTWPVLDSLPHFEFVEKGAVDSTVRADGRYYRQYLIVTSFDSGAHAIPRLLFQAGTKRFYTDSVRIQVDYTKIDPKQDYHDIRDIIDIPNPYVKWIPWIVGAVTLLSIALVIWLVSRKATVFANGRAEKRPEILLTPYEQAMGQLDELTAQKAWENGPVKTYYTRLNEILRLYVSRRLGISSLTETNEELIGKLRPVPMGDQGYSALTETLRMSDFVKFAKYLPAAIDNEHHFRVIRASIDALEKIGAEQDAETARARAAILGEKVK